MTSFGLSTIGRIALTVRDLPSAAEFYREKLGLPLAFSGPKMAFFHCGPVLLALQQADADPPSNPVLYFDVADLEAATLELQTRGVTFHRPPHLVARMPDHDLWLAFFRDPDGNQLALMCRKRRANGTSV